MLMDNFDDIEFEETSAPVESLLEISIGMSVIVIITIVTKLIENIYK